MQKLIMTSCAIAAEEIGKEKADRIADAAARRGSISSDARIMRRANDTDARKSHGLFATVTTRDTEICIRS